MPAAIDQSTDVTNQMRHVIQNLHEVPDFVKRASDNEQFGDPETLQIHLYADPSKRLFPCHTKAATWLSAAYFAHQQSQYSETRRAFVQDRIIKVAEFFGIKPGIQQLFKEAAAVNSYEDAVTPDSAYALTWRDAAGTVQRKYPMRNPSEVKVAAAWFDKNCTEFDFDTRHTIATKLFAKMAEFSVNDTDTAKIERAAGFGYCEKQAMQEAWEKRALLTKKQYPDYSAQAAALAAAVASNDIDLRDFGLRTKMASSMDTFDQQTHLRRFYGETIDWPENTLFAITEKVAAEFLDSHVATATGAVYKRADLRQLSSGDLEDWIGSEFMQKCGGLIMDHKKLAAALPELKKEDAALFDKLAASRGIQVTERMHGETTSLSAEELQAFASAYAAG